MNTFHEIVLQYEKDSLAEAYFSAVQDLFQIKELAPMVRDYLTLQDLPEGTYQISTPNNEFINYMSYSRLFNRFDDSFWPALGIGSDGLGTEFWLMLETGKIISLHHDATFYEEAGWLNVDTKEEFCREFEAVGAYVDLEQLLKIQAASAVLDDGEDDAEEKFTKKVAKILGPKLSDMPETLQDNRLEFIYSLVESYLEELED